MQTIGAIAELEAALANNGISAQQALTLLTAALPLAASSDPQEPLPPSSGHYKPRAIACANNR